MPEAASGTLEPRHIVVPLRMMCPRSELLLGRATALDEGAARRDGRTRRTDRSRSRTTGSSSHSARSAHAAHPGLAEHGHGFKDLADAIALRNHVLRQLELADGATDAGVHAAI